MGFLSPSALGVLLSKNSYAVCLTKHKVIKFCDNLTTLFRVPRWDTLIGNSEIWPSCI
jgi:hypothetical protein